MAAWHDVNSKFGVGEPGGPGDVTAPSPAGSGDAERAPQPSDGSCSTAADGWGEHELADWLVSLNLVFQPYAEKVIENAITAEALMDFADADLQTDLGITNKHHRKRLMKELRKLRTIKVCGCDADGFQQQRFDAASKEIIAAAKTQEFRPGDVADRLWTALRQKGIYVDEHGRSVGGDLESLFSAISICAIGLEALEWRIHGIFKLSFPRKGPSPRQRLENLLKAVMDAKRSLKVGFHTLRNGAGLLTTAIGNSRHVWMRSDAIPAEEEKESKLLQTEFGNWRNTCERALNDVKSRTSPLVQLTQELPSDIAGGEAVEIALKKIPEITGELNELLKQRNTILQQGAGGLESKTVKLAYDAYRFDLTQQTSRSEEGRDRIKAKFEQLQAVARKADVLEVATLRTAFDAIKEERQDWLATFTNIWRTKLDKIATSPTEARKALDDAIAECEAKLLIYQKDIDDLKYAVNNHQRTLEASGLLRWSEKFRIKTSN